MSMTKTILVGLVAGLGFLVVLAVLFPVCSCVSKYSAYHMAMKSDLRNLVTAEEAIRERDSTYRTIRDSSEFAPSTGVTVSVVQAGRDGYVALATHRLVADSCWVFVGNPGRPPARRGVQWAEAEPHCPTWEAERRRTDGWRRFLPHAL